MKIKLKSLYSLLLLVFLLGAVSSCLPEAPQGRRVGSEGLVDDNNNNTPNPVDNNLPETTYIQQGTLQSTSALSIYSDYQDSFLIRGRNISGYLGSLVNPFEKSYCFIASFPNSSNKKILLLNAKVRSVLNYSTQKNEFYFQMEVQNSSANTQNCLTNSVINYINNKYATNEIAISLETLCPNCNSTQNSQAVELISGTGESFTKLAISHLSLNLIFQNSGGNQEVNSCSNNVSCKAQGYNCCLAGQCVNHGAVRPDVDQESPEFLSAKELILNRPELIIQYQHLFYICPTMVPTEPGNPGSGEEIDPELEARELKRKMGHLYNCLNPIQDEFAICTLKFENASEIIDNGGVFANSEKKDDLTISPYNSITEIEYGDTLYYKQKLFPNDTEVLANSSQISFSSSAPNNIFNSNPFASTQTATVNIELPRNAPNDTLYLRYKVDGSCQKMSSTLARCSKTYIQGQASNPARPSDHASGNQVFNLPGYANITSYTVIVSVGGINISEGSDTWERANQAIQFHQPIYNNQEVKITYFVTGQTLVNALTQSKHLAQTQVNSICSCDENCNLKPKYSENDPTSIVSYECSYPNNQGTGPLQEVVYLSSKSVPHKFFDTNGVYYPYGKIPENSIQEGTPFSYKSGNALRPNYDNGTYIGFNEINGSFDKTETAPMPAQVIEIQKGKTYEIFTDSGTFSTCLNCGTDAYNSLAQIFPQNFSHNGAGYTPDFVESRRRESLSKYAADDKLFGRACFVPASMIPWTHVTNADVSTQRRNRQAAQHFLYANGYNRDWYGFDYGAVIGSFDGVNWFAIGNQRKVTAKTNRLFLALNAYFGDVTIDTPFKLVVSETTSVVNSGSDVTHDLMSDGAECQQAHLCKTDIDCFTQVGPEYSCQNVAELRTNWPLFDAQGNETSGSSNVTLLSLLGGSNGQAKRCVYRGRGALCQPNSHSVTAASSYTQSTNPGLHTCSSNTYCEDLNASRFNTRIARYASSLSNQNASTHVTDKTDTVGLAARILGRPYDFFGTQSTPTNVKSQLDANKAKYVCIPGKETTIVNTTTDLNSRRPATRRADKILNLGITPTGNQAQNFYAACGAFDDNGSYLHNNFFDTNAIEYRGKTISQNISTVHFDQPQFDGLNLINDRDERISAIGLNGGSCLKTAGSPCFTDLDCGPSDFIAKKISTMSDLASYLNQAEINFWKEGLVCANNQDRYIGNSTTPNPDYNLNKNTCCREISKGFTYFTATHEDTSMRVRDGAGNALIPGVNQSITDPAKYTRTQLIYDKLLEDPTNYPPLYTATPRPTAAFTSIEGYLRQYNTLQEHNSRMCCTGHWTRKLASGERGNGGGHTLSQGKHQNFEASMFKTLNWEERANPLIFPDYAPFYHCTNENVMTEDCRIKNIPVGSTEERRWLDYFGRLELLGIPQILIPTNTTKLDDIEFYQRLDENFQEVITTGKKPLSGTVKAETGSAPGGTGIPEVYISSTEKYYSANSYNNFDMTKLKKVYSENEFNCCIPTGVEIDSATRTNNDCCTGQANERDGRNRCCLQDYTNLSVYTNAYVSSEGVKNIHINIGPNDIDPETGYIKKEKVMQMGKNMCCSGKAATGVALSDYFIPMDNPGGSGPGRNPNYTTRRWVTNEGIDNAAEVPVNGKASYFNLGLRWNNHVYCVPEDFDLSQGSGGTTGGSASEE